MTLIPRRSFLKKQHPSKHNSDLVERKERIEMKKIWDARKGSAGRVAKPRQALTLRRKI